MAQDGDTTLMGRRNNPYDQEIRDKLRRICATVGPEHTGVIMRYVRRANQVMDAGLSEAMLRDGLRHRGMQLHEYGKRIPLGVTASEIEAEAQTHAEQQAERLLGVGQPMMWHADD